MSGHFRALCRTGSGPPLLAAAGDGGAITIWHLGERKLQTVIHGAHASAVTHLHFFAGEPILMSSGADNSIKHFIFDNADGSARELRSRSGHTAPPTCLAFYGSNVLLSAAQDQAVRVFSVVQDQQSRELSQVRRWTPVYGLSVIS
jgi:U3 small nucleolar RNA-associated protein 21